MKAVLFASAILLAAASASAVAQETPAMPAGGALVAANGMTLYTFDKDPANAGTSACTGGCPSLWPPYRASATDHPAAPYSVVRRDDGSLQWAYKGKPLYFFSQDQTKGDHKGDGFKNIWHVATP